MRELEFEVGLTNSKARYLVKFTQCYKPKDCAAGCEGVSAEEFPGVVLHRGRITRMSIEPLREETNLLPLLSCSLSYSQSPSTTRRARETNFGLLVVQLP